MKRPHKRHQTRDVQETDKSHTRGCAALIAIVY